MIFSQRMPFRRLRQPINVIALYALETFFIYNYPKKDNNRKKCLISSGQKKAVWSLLIPYLNC